MTLPRAALCHLLVEENPPLAAKLGELRTQVDEWLSYTPVTFPHFTSHTVEHSDEIIIQLSKMLFQHEEASSVVVPFSSMEAYVLGAAAYLHDAGMVVSDDEKLEILRSDQWREFLTEDHASTVWGEIETLRSGGPADADVNHFIADRQTRFLLAEFIRRRHHVEGGASPSRARAALRRVRAR